MLVVAGARVAMLQLQTLLLERQTQEVAVAVAGLLQSHLARLAVLAS